MRISSAFEALAQKWEARAKVLRLEGFDDAAKRIENMVGELRMAIPSDHFQLLNPAEAQAESRGYDGDYLRRTLENHGTRFAPLYRKGDLPRHPIRSKKADMARRERRKAKGSAA